MGSLESVGHLMPFNETPHTMVVSWACYDIMLLVLIKKRVIKYVFIAGSQLLPHRVEGGFSFKCQRPGSRGRQQGYHQSIGCTCIINGRPTRLFSG